MSSLRVLAVGPIVMMFAVSVGTTGCSDEGLERYDDRVCEAAIRRGDSVDAEDWLRISSNVPKRFGALSVEESLALVDRLQTAGAKRLVVVPRSVTDKGDSMSGLVVELPPAVDSERARRLALFELYAKRVRELEFEPSADLGQRYLFIPDRRSP